MIYYIVYYKVIKHYLYYHNKQYILVIIKPDKRTAMKTKPGKPQETETETETLLEIAQYCTAQLVGFPSGLLR
jgi:hypothetical protein